MLALLVGLGVVASAIAGDDPATPPKGPSWRGAVWPDQWRGVPRSGALDVPSPVTRDDEVHRVTLKEAIAIALENNPSIAARRLEPTRVGARVLEAQSVFDPQLGVEAAYSRSVTPNPNSLAGVQESVIQDRYANATLQKLLRPGTQFSVAFDNDRLDNNAAFIALRPQYRPELRVSLVQPLLRDFGWDFSYLVVRASEKTAIAAVYQYEAELANFVERVIRAYWAVVGARELVEVRREAKQLADRTVQENEARVRVGLFPPVVVLEAQADAKSREEQLITAENNLALTRHQLAQLAFYRPNATFVPRTLEPVEEVTPEQVDADVDRTLAAALKDRPEIQASSYGVEARQITERIASNALLPRLDLFGSYGVNGLSGRSDGSPGRSLGTFRVTSPVDLGGCTFIAAGVYQCDLPISTQGSPPSSFAGSASDAYDRLASGDFSSYSVGARFTLPFDNAAAKSQHQIRAIERDQAELNHRELLSQVTLEVRQAVADLMSDRQRIATSRVARELAEENLRNQEKRHEVGMATTKDLLDFQTRLSDARFAEVRSKFQYNIDVAAWRRAHGQLLAHYQIVVTHPSRRSSPWFTWF